MPKYTHGGGDGGSDTGEPIKKRLILDKYSTGQDMNVRDILWNIMAAYATKKDMKNEIKKFSQSKTALSRIALSILENPESAYYGLSLNFVSLYSLMMMLDGGWNLEFREFLRSCYVDNTGYRKIIGALKKLLLNKEYREQITRYFKELVSLPEYAEGTLAYINEIKDKILVESMKKELIIIARNDIDSSQRNAMSCLFLLNDQQDTVVLISQLLTHWDELTREHAATLLRDSQDENALKIARSQFAIESNPKIKKLLGRIIEKRNKRNEHK